MATPAGLTPYTLANGVQAYKNVSGQIVNGVGGALDETGGTAGATPAYDPFTVKPVTSSPSVISSQKGAEIVGQQTDKLNKLSTTPVITTTTTTPDNSKGTVTPPPTTKVTLINPNTDQLVTFENADLNKDSINTYLQNGYKVSEAAGNIPTWLKPDSVSTGTSATDKAKAEMDSAASDLKTLTDNLTKFTMSDADLSQQVQGITAQWDARIADMEKINQARENSINTTGIRLGSRFAGGKGGAFGGIISEEERQGAQRVADLEGQKQAAISAAKLAFMQQNWTVYSKQVDLAEKAYEQKVQALSDLQKATADQNKAIADALRKMQEDNYTQYEKPKNDLLASAVKNGAPQSVIDAIDGATNLSDAIQAAGTYLQDVPTSGIVGEYLFYKKQAELAGQMPVDFNEYQNIDANRKKSIAQAGAANGLSTQMIGKVLTVADQFDGEQVVKDYNTTATQVNYIKNLGDKPTDDIARVYAFAKVMDPNSAVREGEYKTVQDYAQAVLQSAGLKAKRVFTNSGFLTDEARNFIDSTLQSRLATQQKTYKNIYDEYGRRINKITGSNDGTDYITDYSQGYDTTGQIITSKADNPMNLDFSAGAKTGTSSSNPAGI